MGYTECPCRDCFDISMDHMLCDDCHKAGCVKGDDPDYQHPNLRSSLECQRVDAYGMDQYCQEHGNAVCRICPEVE